MDYLEMVLWLDDGMGSSNPQVGIIIIPCEKEMGKSSPANNAENAGEKNSLFFGKGMDIWWFIWNVMLVWGVIVVLGKFL